MIFFLKHGFSLLDSKLALNSNNMSLFYLAILGFDCCDSQSMQCTY